MLKCVVVLGACTAIAGCASVSAPDTGGTAVLPFAYSSGFFGGMHSFPYANRLKPGRIYATTHKAKGPVFGAEVSEICWDDTDALVAKFPDRMRTRAYEGEENVVKTVGSGGEFGLEGVKLPHLEIGASANYVNSITYTFDKVTEIEVEVEEGTDGFVMANIQTRCRQLIAGLKKQGRYVFVAKKVYQPEKSSVAMEFKPNVSASLKASILKGMSPGITANWHKNNIETRGASNKVVEVKASEF